MKVEIRYAPHLVQPHLAMRAVFASTNTVCLKQVEGLDNIRVELEPVAEKTTMADYVQPLIELLQFPGIQVQTVDCH